MFRMMTTVGVCVLMMGCFDFAGDRREVVFATSLTVDGVTAWTPSSPVASAQPFQIQAEQWLEEEDTKPLMGRIKASRGTVTGSGNDALSMVSPRRGEVLVTARGTVTDTFRFRVERPKRLAVNVAGEQPERLVLLKGASVPVPLEVLGRRGEALGYAPEAVKLTCTGAIQCTSTMKIENHADDPGFVVGQDVGEGVLEFRHGNRRLRLDVSVVDGVPCEPTQVVRRSRWGSQVAQNVCVSSQGMYLSAVDD